MLALCFCAIPLTAQEAETDEAEYRSSIELFVGGVTETEEYTRECLAIVVERKLRSDDVLHTLAELFAEHGAPEHLRSDNGPEFTAKVVRTWLKRVGVRTLFIEPGSPWENGYNESFNGKLKDELMNREIFYSLKEAQVLVEQWRRSGGPCCRGRDLLPD